MKAQEVFDTLNKKYAAASECYSNGEFSHCNGKLLTGALPLLEQAINSFPQGRPIDEYRPEMGKVLAWCCHAEDDYVLEEGKRLTTYGAHAEGVGHVEDGFHLVGWGGMYHDEDFGGSPYTISDWWFVVGTDFDIVANPTHFWVLPEGVNK